MQNISLTFHYSLDFEKKRIKSTLDNADWFIEHGYSQWINLPCGKKLEEAMSDEKTDYLFDEVEEEYSEEDFKKVENEIKEQWEKSVPLFIKYFEKTQFNPENVYRVYLTRYGVGGSYKLPNKVIINIKRRSSSGVLKTVIHEIIHLSIQPLIERYNVEHWKKERLVDLILENNFPITSNRQGIPIGTEIIDESFERYYPNIEEIVRII